MKKFLLLIGLTLIIFASKAQVTCPTPVTQFNFTFSRPVSVNQKLGGATVCDQDVGQSHVWTIPSGNASNILKLTTSGKDVSILVNDAAAINASTSPSYTITLTVTDNGVPPLSSSATVIFTDGNSAPIVNNQAFTIAENSTNSTSVGTVIASDPNANQVLTYSIISGNTSGAFAINSSTGVILVANSAALNYETTPSFSLVVKVQDNGTGSLSSQATITINLTNVNEAPIISNTPM